VQLGNMYFDAERYDEAARWYEQAIGLNPKDINVSTDLGVSYYYQGQYDRALQQFDHSLSLDGKHLKTLLNQGIVRAFGKQDLDGAAASWQKVIAASPESQEGQAAKRLLDNLKTAHPGGAAPTSTPRG
jgi:tetratricopeptide (TPR) repeat protein